MLSSNIRDLIELIAAAQPPASVPGPNPPRTEGYENSPEAVAVAASQADRDTSPGYVSVEIGQLIASLESLNRAADVPVPIPASSAANRSQSGGSTAGLVQGIGKTLLGGFGVASLFSGLFGGGAEPEDLPLPKFELPTAINAALSFDRTSGEFAPVSYSAAGTPREGTSTQVTVNVNAMDSRSFMDHSADIARAVREALLNSHSLNDVIAEL